MPHHRDTRFCLRAPRGPSSFPKSFWMKPFASLVALGTLALGGLATACGGGGTTARAPGAGSVSPPGAPLGSQTTPAVLGSQEGSEVQGVRARYVVPKGSSHFTFFVKIVHPQRRTPVKVLFDTPAGTLPSVAAEPNYQTANVTVPLLGAPEGVHLATVGALYDGDERGPTVTFEVQVGASTAPARANLPPPDTASTGEPDAGGRAAGEGSNGETEASP